MSKRNGLFAVLLTILCVSLFCAALYQWDNKYTKNTLQPVNGVFYYEDTELVSWLTRQWTVYPDVLLTPETLSSYTGYRYYEDIGSQEQRGRHSMTYRLTLILPEETGDYALELPEVFSACALYINDRMVLQQGNPEPKNYREAISSRIVAFSASGKTELLLAVSDYSGRNIGLTYPPAFGNAEDLLAMRELRTALHLGLVILALAGALLSFSFLFTMYKERGILTGLLCVCLAVVTGYPLYHGLIKTTVQPWYTIEPMCYYGLLLLSVVLYTSLCEINRKRQYILAALSAAGAVLLCIALASASALPEWTQTAVSWFSAFLKYSCATLLLLLSLRCFWLQKLQTETSTASKNSLILLCGAAALATTLLWDRLLPLYEPVYGGWFGEIGGGFLVLSLTAVILLDARKAYHFRLIYENNMQQMEYRLAMQKEHYQQLSHQVRLAREAGHDLRHHIRTMRSLAEQNQWERLQHYLNEYEPHVKERQLTIWSDHPAADAVLGYYAPAAQKCNAVYDVRLAISPDLAIPDDELCIILGNLLENAIDAVQSQPSGARRIYLRGEVSGGRLGIVMDNTFSGTVQQNSGIFTSTKHNGCGLGLTSIITIAEKYGGLADFSASGGIFHASILIPLSSISGQTEKQKKLEMQKIQ